MPKQVRIVHKEHGQNPIRVEVGDPSKGAKARKLIKRARQLRREFGLSKKKAKIVKE